MEEWVHSKEKCLLLIKEYNSIVLKKYSNLNEVIDIFIKSSKQIIDSVETNQ